MRLKWNNSGDGWGIDNTLGIYVGSFCLIGVIGSLGRKGVVVLNLGIYKDNCYD